MHVESDYKLALFLSLPTVQFLITCSMQKWRGKAYSISSRVSVSLHVGRQREGEITFRVCILCFDRVVCFLLCKCSKLQGLGQKPQNKVSSSLFVLSSNLIGHCKHNLQLRVSIWEIIPTCYHRNKDKLENIQWEFLGTRP